MLCIYTWSIRVGLKYHFSSQLLKSMKILFKFQNINYIFIKLLPNLIVFHKSALLTIKFSLLPKHPQFIFLNLYITAYNTKANCSLPNNFNNNYNTKLVMF